MTNKRLLDKVAKCMHLLVARNEENCIFVSQYKENEKDKATVLIHLVEEAFDDDNNAYLAVRRLLTALAYRLSENTEFELEFNLKKKGK